MTMGVRENKVETYLREQIKLHFNGDTRKWVSPGRDGVMDQICFIDPEWFVEVKTIDGDHTTAQKREANRLIKLGARVVIVWGHAGVDKFIYWLQANKHTQPQVQVIFR